MVHGSIFFIMCRNRIGEKRFCQNVTKYFSFTERFTRGSYCIHQLWVLSAKKTTTYNYNNNNTTTKSITLTLFICIVLMYDIL